jgi:hypothetical protein
MALEKRAMGYHKARRPVSVIELLVTGDEQGDA